MPKYTPAQTKYYEKLKDPRWQKKRLEIFERDEYICQSCNDDKSTLHVHHRNYIKGKDPWDYPNEFLVTLCETCHEVEKEELEEYVPLLIENIKKKFFADDMRELAFGFSQLQPFHDSHVMASTISWVLGKDELLHKLTEMYFKSLADKKREQEK